MAASTVAIAVVPVGSGIMPENRPSRFLEHGGY